jgi:SAM-dependent methyltransferase
MDHGEIEQEAAGAQSRLDQQAPWLRQLPRDFVTILDVGAGMGVHSKWFLETGYRPTALDRSGSAFEFGDQVELLKGDLFDLDPSRLFDAVFCSHVVEHFPDPATGIVRMREALLPGGYLFVIVPPYTPVSVNYHWHIGWNCTQLALLLVALGFDCSQATFMQLGMNICGWGRKAEIPETQFNLRLSLPYLPKGMVEQFYVKDGYDFIAGDLIYADQTEARRAPVEMNFDFPVLDLNASRELSFEMGAWASIERSWDASRDITQADWKMVVVVEGAEVAFRIAVGSGLNDDRWLASAERYVGARPGLSVHVFRASDFSEGTADMRAVRHISIGGRGTGRSTLRFWCQMPDGSWF